MLPLCRAEGIGVIPWSPLAKGRLTRDWDEARSEIDEVGKRIFSKMADADRKIVERVAQVAAKRGIPRAQVALARVLQMQQEPVTAPIIGATKLNHLEDAVAALSLKLDSNEIASLEEPYIPHPVVGISIIF